MTVARSTPEQVVNALLLYGQSCDPDTRAAVRRIIADAPRSVLVDSLWRVSGITHGMAHVLAERNDLGRERVLTAALEAHG